MRNTVIMLFMLSVMLSGCVKPPQTATTTTLEEATQTMETTKPTENIPSTTLFECRLSLCDCKCHPKGTTIEETTGRLCGINCRGEYNIEGCKIKDGSCTEVTVATTTTEPAQLPNPASQKCVSDGGTLDIINEADGQRGICHFKDGTVCDEWAYFRGECAMGDCICAAVGTRSEGWYCNGKLLYWDQCSSDPAAFRDCSRYENARVCTMEYNPVCAKVRAQAGIKWQTFGNACTACTQAAAGETVIGYRQGECA